MPKIELSKEQQEVVFEITKRIRNGDQMSNFAGTAGSGKTVVISYLTQIFPRFAVCAYTGKAANVLRTKGCQASTIHSLIYKPIREPNGRISFNLKENHELGYDGFFVDEASMVSRDIHKDLKSFGLPIVYVGDHGQLPPVMAKDFNVMADPMFKLEKIHRNAGVIARFCEWVRHGYTPRSFPEETDKIKFIKPWDITPKILTSVDQIICTFNKTRVELNKKTRAALGYTDLLNVGDRVMCLRNNKQLALFNGLQGVVTGFRAEKKSHLMNFETDDFYYEDINYDPKQFNQEKVSGNFEGPMPFDYSYCVTAHKSQGDEWLCGLVIEQPMRNIEHNRLCYTEASRFKEEITWCCP